jgi:ankyrin repeat protein
MRTTLALLVAACLAACTPILVTTMGAAKAGAESRAHESPGTTALHRAAYDQDVAEVRRLLAGGARVDARNEKGDTPLAFALMLQRTPGGQANVAVVEALLRAGADPNAVESWSGQVMLVAALRSQAEVRRTLLKLLMDHGANVDAAPRHGETALLHAVRSSMADEARMFIAAGADLRARPYVLEAMTVPAACERSAAAHSLPKAIVLVRLLLEAGAPVEASDLQKAEAHCIRRDFNYGSNRLVEFVRAESR